jgi:hypothetical protein
VKYSDFLLLTAVILVAPKVEQCYVAMAITFTVFAMVIEFIDRKK